MKVTVTTRHWRKLCQMLATKSCIRTIDRSDFKMDDHVVILSSLLESKAQS